MRSVKDPAAVATADNASLGQPVVSAASTQDAVNAACQGLKEEGGGSAFIATASGMGAVAVATAFYSSGSGNPNLVIKGQRAAYMNAHMRAKAALAKLLNGVSVDGKRFLAEQLQSLDDAEGNVTNTSMSLEERGSEVVSAMLRGVIVYDMVDSPAEGTVTVSVVTTPKTQGAVQEIAPGICKAQSLEEGLEQIFAQIKSGLVPPDGGNIVTSLDGRVAWVGYGSAIRTKNNNKQVAAKLAQAAKSIAERRSRESLLAVINGQKVVSDQVDMEEYASSIKQFDVAVDEAGNESIRKKAQDEVQELATLALNEQFGEETVGQLPPGIVTRTYTSKDGNWVYGVSVFFAQATDQAKALAKSMAENSPMKSRASGGFRINPDGSFARDASGKLIPASMGSGRIATDPEFAGRKR